MHSGSFEVRPCEVKGIVFDRIDISELFFGHAASILIAQGMAIQDLFSMDSRFESEGHVLARAPFIYLAGEYAALADPPARIKKAIIANIIELPEEISKREDLLAALLQAVQQDVRR
jgi:hypothetical protein